MAADGLQELLDELERRLRAFGAPIAGAFRAGAAPRRVRETLAAEDVTPHGDLVAWWGWHDGAEVDAPPFASSSFLHLCAENAFVGPWHFLSLDEALSLRRWQRDEHEKLGIGRLFPRSWVPVLTTDGAGELCANTDANGPAPLQIHDEGYLGGEPPHFASLAEFVELAIEAFDRGLVEGHPHDARAPRISDHALRTDLRRLVTW